MQQSTQTTANNSLTQVLCELLPPLVLPSTTAVHDVAGIVTLQGTMTAVALVPPHTTTTIAARCLQHDASRSLLARLELAAEDAAEVGDGKLFRGDASARLQLAQRVAVDTGCRVCCTGLFASLQ